MTGNRERTPPTTARAQNTSNGSSPDPNEGENQKRGFPGSLSASRTFAPDSADDKSIQSIAWVANEFGLKRTQVDTLWRTVEGLSRQAREAKPEPGDDAILTKFGGQNDG